MQNIQRRIRELNIWTVAQYVAIALVASDAFLLYSYTPRKSLAGANWEMNLIDASIKDLAEGLRLSKFSSASLVEAYIARIKQVNDVVKAVGGINPDALEIARERDKERNTGQRRGVLHGIPFLVKDSLLTTDHMQTTAGCSGLKGARPKFEATVIKKLREQGAILLGKTALTEYANYRSPQTAPNGWSAVHGQCIAPYAENQDPSGSSSGSAVSVALGLCAFGIGTETEGSITNPAQRSAVIGFKPTTGLTSRHRVYAGSEYQDSVGVHGRTVEDCALALSAMAGEDAEDSFTIHDPRDAEEVKRPSAGVDFASSLGVHGLEGVRIAVIPSLLDEDEARQEATKKAIEIMRYLGAIVTENASFAPMQSDIERGNDKEWHHMERFLQSFESLPKDFRTLADVIAYTRGDPEERCEEYGIDEWLAAEQEGQHCDLGSHAYNTSLSRRLAVGAQATELLDRYDCDVYLCSASRWQPAMAGGCPTISIPIGIFPSKTPVKRRSRTGLVQKAPGIPFGIVMTARRWDDKKLIEAAYAFERAIDIRSKLDLKIKPTAEIEVDTTTSNGTAI